jgi:Protein of unknown function (DUF3455)
MKTLTSCASVGTLSLALVLAGPLLGSTARADDEEPVPAPAGTALVLEASADGVQIYSCEVKDKVYSWVFKAPEANLFGDDDRQIGTHFTGPSWKAADGSVVTGEVVAQADAPDGDAVPWLLLKAKSHSGPGLFASVNYIRRSDTTGGMAPEAGCDANHVSEQARMRYSATYQFYK